MLGCTGVGIRDAGARTWALEGVRYATGRAGVQASTLEQTGAGADSSVDVDGRTRAGVQTCGARDFCRLMRRWTCMGMPVSGYASLAKVLDSVLVALLVLDDQGSSFVVRLGYLPVPADLRMNDDSLLCRAFFCIDAQVVG
ncbi:hypothetical protein CDL15_Pgr024798 [Punica granatum]|uniref:Uncharacterized protein n=1 Tax=Punica granatum TaxID=22663 RepID=A0A218WJC0_PUNGR|nr:hypothetical protein CDL15_Pgr024798 [Punica granatum]